MLIKPPPAKSPWRARLILVGVVAAIVGVFFLIRAFSATGQATVRMQNVLPYQHIEPIGNDILVYDGISIFRLGANGSRRWPQAFQTGPNAGYHTSNRHVVAWSGNQLHILDANSGRALFNDRMESTVQFARAGNNYVAVFVGERDVGSVYVLDYQGRRVDTVEIRHTVLMDIGFFSQPREMMWILGLEVDGTVPTATLQTFDPGSLVTGSATLGEQLVYRVYYHNGDLRTVDTRRISTYNYRIRETATPVLIYGWYMQDVRVINRELYQLLVPMPNEDGSMNFTDLRLIRGNATDRVLHLPASCVGVVLGSRAVYAFAGSRVYTCRYGEISFVPTDLSVHVTRVIGITQDDRAIVADNNDVYLIQLPH
ncbi:MAG: hypothetical protein FWD25_00365 [Clostridia bacterium]|nr:hypothetical protein [Clostridia bacterium]